MKTTTSLFMSMVLLAFAAVAQSHLPVAQETRPHTAGGAEGQSVGKDERDSLAYKQVVIQRAEMWALRRKLDVNSQ